MSIARAKSAGKSICADRVRSSGRRRAWLYRACMQMARRYIVAATSMRESMRRWVLAKPQAARCRLPTQSGVQIGDAMSRAGRLLVNKARARLTNNRQRIPMGL